MDVGRGSGRLEQAVPPARASEPTLSEAQLVELATDEQGHRGPLRVQRRHGMGLPGRDPLRPAGPSDPEGRPETRGQAKRRRRTDHGPANGRLPQSLVSARLPRVPGQSDRTALRAPDGSHQLRLLCARRRHRGAHRPRRPLRPEGPHRGPRQGRPRYPDHEHHHPRAGDAAGQGGHLLGEADERLLRPGRPGLSGALLRLRGSAVAGSRRGGQGAGALPQGAGRQGHPGLLQRQRRTALHRQVRSDLGAWRTSWICPSWCTRPCR